MTPEEYEYAELYADWLKSKGGIYYMINYRLLTREEWNAGDTTLQQLMQILSQRGWRIIFINLKQEDFNVKLQRLIPPVPHYSVYHDEEA